jgi:hypothetical protein
MFVGVFVVCWGGGVRGVHGPGRLVKCPVHAWGVLCKHKGHPEFQKVA